MILIFMVISILGLMSFFLVLEYHVYAYLVSLLMSVILIKNSGCANFFIGYFFFFFWGSFFSFYLVTVFQEHSYIIEYLK